MTPKARFEVGDKRTSSGEQWQANVGQCLEGFVVSRAKVICNRAELQSNVRLTRDETLVLCGFVLVSDGEAQVQTLDRCEPQACVC